MAIYKDSSLNKYIILSDSLSSLTGINNMLNPTDISILIQEKTFEARQKGIEISFLWIPGHCGIDGNELADQEARKAASSNDTQMLNLCTFTAT
jgi:ribonuclease HI